MHRKNSGDKGDNAGDPDLKDAWALPSASSIDVDEEETVPAVSDEEPLTDLEKLLAEEAGGFNALDLEVIKDRKLTQEDIDAAVLKTLELRVVGAGGST